jgi:glutaredoxin-related protein
MSNVKQVFVDPNYSNRRGKQRIEEAEKELEELMGGQVQEEPKATESKEDEPTDPEEKSFKKRYGDLRRHMAEKEKEWEERLKALEEGPTSRTVLPPKSDEDIAQWASKYPDVASIVETIANKKADEKLSKYKNQFEEYEKITQDNVRQKAYNVIRDSHPDFDDLRKSDAFHEWADEQPKWVQDSLYENEDDPKAVIRILDLYKVDKGLTPSAKKVKSREAASIVTPKNKASADFDLDGTKIYESQVARMSMEAYGKNEQKIMEAMRKGNFVYDISGGAR